MMNARLTEVIADVLQLQEDQIRPDLKQDDVPTWDSQTHLELVMSLETAFGVEFDMAEVTEFRTLGDIENKLRQYRALGD